MTTAGAHSAPELAPVQWGVTDAALAWFVSLVFGALAVAPFVDHGHIPHADEPLATVVGLVFQTGATIAFLFVVARGKGRGSLARDFGLRIHLRDCWWIGVGFVVSLIGLGLIEPILELGHLHQSSQDVKRILDHAHGADLGLMVLGVLVIAPVGEELLFRGALGRGLQRRFDAGPALFISAMAFALVHVALDPGTGFGVPALVLLGLVSGVRAVKTRDLSQSLFLHMGFNLVAVVVRLGHF